MPASQRDTGAANAYAQVGHGGLNYSGALSGDFKLAPMSTLALVAGGANAFAHLGHGGAGTNGSKSGEIGIVAETVLLQGGTSLAACAQIGHGGNNSQGGLFDGGLSVISLGDISLLGGSGGSAYVQIGHGGSSADAAMRGDIVVASGGDLTLAAPHLANGAYAKIGHGDDLRGTLAVLGGTGTRDGDITASGGGSIVLSGAMIGHLNDASPATALGGVTQVGASRNDPTNPAGGNIVADSLSQFHGADELRFYLPRRSNNRIAAGAVLNGEVYGGAPDRWESQRSDEYTVNLINAKGQISVPAEHGNAFGTGPAPSNSAGYAFYYDTIAIGNAPPPAPPEGPTTPPGGPPPPSAPLLDFRSLFPNDRAYEDWAREMEGLYSGYRLFGIYYEGYEQYGTDGQSLFQWDQAGAALPEGTLLSMPSMDDPLRRHIQLLAEISESGEGDEEEEDDEEEATELVGEEEE